MLHDIIKPIISQLFVAEWRRIDVSIERLNRQNNEINNVSDVGFILEGNFFRSKAELLANGTNGQRVLHSSLADQAKIFLLDKKTLTHDQQMIKQSLVHLIKDCKSDQDLRDTLPECLLMTLPIEVRMHSRTREAAYTIIDNPRALYQYNLVYPRIEFYSAARLMY